MKEQNNNKSKYYNNLTKDERTTLKELADRNDIIITKADADEGRAVVIHHTKINTTLTIETPTKSLDPTQPYAIDIITLFKNDKLITERIAKGIEVQQSETPKFYTRPKIYKAENPKRAVEVP